ncbi:vWA domain-containing protein [Sorangium sp. So ce1335]|uniref:vWA domain-containing protein n=1 Tax=Sorangium sp. So ce1335 TaxID=3133335 RepID=UPI003F5DCE81
MGKGDKDWHDKSLKWDPVVAATRQFFADPASEGLTASLSFFPDEEDRCELASYTTPDVALTPLPSEAFGAAIDVIEPMTSSDWRGGTPTAWVMRGTVSFIEAQRQAAPGKYAIVLVTDGYPQGCDEADDTIQAVMTDAEAALAKNIPTYVIGVANPPLPDAPDTVSDLHKIAAAGGTEQAVLIDTGDPSQTVATFAAALEEIRSASVSCTMAIPPAPDGRSFDKEKVRVLYTAGGSNAPTELSYDQGCATEGAWRYDDPASPTEIVLCVSSCDTIQADTQAVLSVDFTCESVIEVPL